MSKSRNRRYCWEVLRLASFIASSPCHGHRRSAWRIGGHRRIDSPRSSSFQHCEIRSSPPAMLACRRAPPTATPTRFVLTNRSKAICTTILHFLQQEVYFIFILFYFRKLWRRVFWSNNVLIMSQIPIPTHINMAIGVKTRIPVHNPLNPHKAVKISILVIWSYDSTI